MKKLPQPSPGKLVHVVSLGCPKNRVDTEVMLGHLAGDGYVLAETAAAADLIVINTCAFVDAAKEESIDAIAEACELKREHAGKRLLVAGCLSQRYAPELAQELPEVDHFLGTGNLENIVSVLRGDPGQSRSASSALPILQQPAAEQPQGVRAVRPLALPAFQHHVQLSDGRAIEIPDPDLTLSAASPRVLTQPAHSVYVKVSEGCSNRCAFCIIPRLRGPQRSRTVADVVAEAARLLDGGAVELNLIAQDLCAYGHDLQPPADLAQLLRALDRVAERAGRPVWLRCLYAYPKGLTRQVIDVLARAKHIVPYLDMPLQHISDTMLRRMRRGKGSDSTRALLRRLREHVGNLTLRTTFITGMPGETEREFEELLAFVAEQRFTHVGVFPYSREEGTPAGSMSQQVDPEVASMRRDQLMALQQQISREHHTAMIGRTVDVLVDGQSDETELLLVGRHAGQAPDVDGVTYINSGVACPGDVVRVCLDQASDYDLVGGIVGHVHRASTPPAPARGFVDSPGRAGYPP